MKPRTSGERERSQESQQESIPRERHKQARETAEDAESRPVYKKIRLGIIRREQKREECRYSQYKGKVFGGDEARVQRSLSKYFWHMISQSGNSFPSRAWSRLC